MSLNTIICQATLQKYFSQKRKKKKEKRKKKKNIKTREKKGVFGPKQRLLLNFFEPILLVLPPLKSTQFAYPIYPPKRYVRYAEVGERGVRVRT